MGFFKILGGVALGVGAVAAAPFTGGGSIVGAATLAGSLAGAGTVAAAVGAGVVGGVAVSAMSDAEKEEGRREGKREATAEYDKKLEKFSSQLGVVEKKLADTKDYFRLLIALFSVGMATANADGEIVQSELEDLDEFVLGVLKSSALPKDLKDRVQEIKDNPPNFSTAVSEIKQLKNIENYEIFETVIEIISLSDGILHEKEKEFLASFKVAVA